MHWVSDTQNSLVNLGRGSKRRQKKEWWGWRQRLTWNHSTDICPHGDKYSSLWSLSSVKKGEQSLLYHPGLLWSSVKMIIGRGFKIVKFHRNVSQMQDCVVEKSWAYSHKAERAWLSVLIPSPTSPKTLGRSFHLHSLLCKNGLLCK